MFGNETTFLIAVLFAPKTQYTSLISSDFPFDKTISSKNLFPIFTNCFGRFMREEVPAAKIRTAIFFII